MARFAALSEIGGTQQPASIGTYEVGPVGPLPHEVAVVPASGDHHMRGPECQRPVGARARAQPEDGLAGQPAWRGSTTMSFMPRLGASMLAVACVRRV